VPLPLLPLGLELPLVPGPIGLPEPDPAVPDPILPLPGSVELLPEPIDAPIPELSLEPEVVELGSPDPMQWDEIAAAQESSPVRILRGTESDILADGSLDYPDSVLEGFDLVIASIHARHRMDRSAMTARLTRAMSLPIFKVWGHGLGRILNHRDAIDCDVSAVLDVLAGSPGAIELNSDPQRLDLPPEWIPAARERKIPFVISVDAHSTRGLGVLRYGVLMARRGGVLRSEVLNTEPAERFVALVRPTQTG